MNACTWVGASLSYSYNFISLNDPRGTLGNLPPRITWVKSVDKTWWMSLMFPSLVIYPNFQHVDFVTIYCSENQNRMKRGALEYNNSLSLPNCDGRKVFGIIENHDSLNESSHFAYFGWWVGWMLAERYWKQWSGQISSSLCIRVWCCTPLGWSFQAPFVSIGPLVTSFSHTPMLSPFYRLQVGAQPL